MSAPMDFLSNNKWNLAAAAAPAFMDAFGGDDKEETAAPKQQSGNLYMYKKDPATGQSYAYKTYSGDEVKNAPPMVFGNAGGGLMRHYDAGGPVKFGNVTDAFDAKGNPIIPATENTVSDSQKAQDYLLGKPGAVNPFLFYHKGPAAAALVTAPVAALSTAGISALTSGEAWSNRGGPGLKEDPNPEWTKKTDEEKAQWFADNPDSPVTKLQKIIEARWPLKNTPEYKKQVLITQGLDPKTSLPVGFVDNSGEAWENMLPTRYTPVPGTPVEAPAPEGAVTFGPIGPEKAITTTNLPTFVDPAEKTLEQQIQENADRIDKTIQGWESSRGAAGYSGDGGYTGGYQKSGEFSGMPSSFGGVGSSPYAKGGITALAQGGMYNLGSYSDGGRLLKGPGDGVSDGIPATIGQNQPARLADGEFVVPARIVSELGNGSTEAGARKLYAMMDRVQKARSKTVGKDKVAANSRADKYLPV
jgi:hypothetical protein